MNSHVVPPGAVGSVVLCVLEDAFLADVFHDDVETVEVFPVVHSAVEAVANAAGSSGEVEADLAMDFP